MIDYKNVESVDDLGLVELSKIGLDTMSEDIFKYHFFEVVEDMGEGIERTKAININNKKIGSKWAFYTDKNGKKTGYWKRDLSLQVSEHWTTIPDNFCRECEKEITHEYTENYLEDLDCGEYVLYNFHNGYCQECAKKLSTRKHKYAPVKDCWVRETRTSVCGETYIFRTDAEGFVTYSKPAALRRQQKSN